MEFVIFMLIPKKRVEFGDLCYELTGTGLSTGKPNYINVGHTTDTSTAINLSLSR
jgi:hypothetical protein